MIRKTWSIVPIIAVVCLGVAMPSYAQLGIFESTADWGGPDFPPQRGDNKIEGSVTVTGTGSSAVYEMEGNGNDIWDASDEGFFVYKELSGSWSLSSKVEWFDPGTNDWAKMGVMVRDQGAVTDSKHYWVELRGGSLGDRTDAQWRDSAGGSSSNEQLRTAADEAIAHHDGNLHLRVTRIASIDLVFCEWSPDGTTWNFGHSMTMEMGETVAYGLAITNHEDDADVAVGQFANVELNPAPPVVSRALPGMTYIPGGSIDVTLNIINPSDGAASLSVSENVPEGWTASNISDGGSESGGVISWSVSAPAGASSLTYSISSGPGGELTFSGTGGDYGIMGADSIGEGLPETLKVVWSEDFESTAEGSLPSGWNEVNYTEPGGNEQFLTWAVQSYDTIAGIGGNRVNEPVVDGNSCYADSDGYGSPYYEAHLTTPSIDLSGVTNVYLVYDSNYMQNQDNIGVLEYSIDGGTVGDDVTGTWLPIAYLMDTADIFLDADGNIDAIATLEAEADGSGFAYGDYAYAMLTGMTEEDIAPYISARINDDTSESKRHEIYRLPEADNQSNVVITWLNMGTFSWFWGLDNVQIWGDDGTSVADWSLY